MQNCRIAPRPSQRLNGQAFVIEQLNVGRTVAVAAGIRCARIALSDTRRASLFSAADDDAGWMPAFGSASGGEAGGVNEARDSR